MSKFNLTALDELEEQERSKKNVSKSASILCVDDEPSNLKALKMLLEDDYNVFTAQSGHQALEILAKNQIEVIITDQRMPELLGTELLEELLRRRLSNNVRIILTGFADVSVLMECINKGLIDRYILKPWSPEELLGTVRNAVERISTKRALHKLVPERVMTKLYPEGLSDVKVGFGKEISGAMLFADIQRFTSLIETMDAIDSFRLISSFFSHIGPIVEKHHGFIDKYLGDGIMAIFDNPDTGNVDCVNCAVEMLQETVRYNKLHRSNDVPAFRHGMPKRVPLDLGVGINFGQVVLGTVGCLDRIDVTVLGDAVNTTSRIQGLSGLLGAQMLASEEIVNQLAPSVQRRYLGQYLVRGKTKGIPIWEVFAHDPQELIACKEASKEQFENAIKSIENGRQEDAIQIFESIVRDCPLDRTSQYFLVNLKNRSSELLFQMLHK